MRWLINQHIPINYYMLITITNILEGAEANLKQAEAQWEAIKNTVDAPMSQYVTEALREVKNRVLV